MVRLRHDPNPTYYSVTADEIEQLQQQSAESPKDLTVGFVGIALPCLINAAIQVFSFTSWATLVFNGFFGLLFLALGVIFGIEWSRKRRSGPQLVEKIKSRPAWEVEFVGTQSGDNPTRATGAATETMAAVTESPEQPPPKDASEDEE